MDKKSIPSDISADELCELSLNGKIDDATFIEVIREKFLEISGMSRESFNMCVGAADIHLPHLSEFESTFLTPAINGIMRRIIIGKEISHIDTYSVTLETDGYRINSPTYYDKKFIDALDDKRCITVPDEFVRHFHYKHLRLKKNFRRSAFKKYKLHSEVAKNSIHAMQNYLCTMINFLGRTRNL